MPVAMKVRLETENPAPDKDLFPNNACRELALTEKSSIIDSAIAMPSALLEQAARHAGTFKRSALGYLDHPEWLSRFEADARALVAVLTAMGFAAEVAGPHQSRACNDE